MNRKKVAARNSITSVMAQMFQVLASFVMRRMFVHYIGIEYLGVNTVLTDVLEMLSLTELGVQGAIVFRLYKPLLTNDIDAISEIMTLLRKLYLGIGTVIFVIGLCLSPFLGFIITNVAVPMMTVYIIYFILLISSVVTYYMGYWRTLLYADQQQYIISIIDFIISLICTALKIAVIFYLRNIYLYTAITLFKNVIFNLALRYCAHKHYPQLELRRKAPKALKRDLFADVKNIFAGKLASYVYSSTDNLVISSIIGTTIVGYIGNYKSITSAVGAVATNIFFAMQPMVGNYLASESREKAYDFFKKYSFIRYFVICIILLPTISVIRSFITWWMGPEFVLPQMIPILIIIDIYISIVHGPTGEFITASGLFSYERNVYLLGAFLNIVTSVAGTFWLGVEGVLWGTVISQIIMWIGRSIIVYRHCFQCGIGAFVRYWVREFLYALVFFLECIVVYKFCSMFTMEGDLLIIILQAAAALIVCVLFHTVVWGRTKEFIYFREWSFTVLKKIFKAKTVS